MLKLLGTIYGVVTDLRNTLYERGIFKSHSLGVRTISVGNITTGGTGKTPLVAYIAELLSDAGERVCILTRGYGRDNAQHRVLVSDGDAVLVNARAGGDEPVELARRLLNRAVVIADADRVSAAAWVKEQFEVSVFVLDDAFQHRRVTRDLDIVCVDATDPFGGGSMLPAGRLRESSSNLARADAIVITRSDLADDIAALRNSVREMKPTAAVFLAVSKIRNADELTNEQPVLAFCGLGNPNGFFELLRRTGVRVAATRVFPDHHYYTQKEIVELERTARDIGAAMLLTTVKDMVKLEGLKREMPCIPVELSIEIEPVTEFHRLITSS